MELEFTSYFKNQWLCERNKNWYEGAKHFCPKTNNALESFNSKIKDDFHFRERSTMPNFKRKMFDMLHHLSCEYRDRIKVVSNKVVISKKDWLNGYNWATSVTKVLEKKLTSNRGKVTYFLSVETDIIDQKVVDAYTNNKWKSFADFVQFASTIREVTFEINPQIPEQWRTGTCTCREYFKEYICEHVVGMSLRLHLIEMPNNLKQLSQMKKRGRPSKPGPALSLI